MIVPHKDNSDPHQTQPKALWAYDAIREAIISMRLSPGAVLNDKETCQALGVSRTPMREAVLRLAQEGLVQVVPSGGTYVSKLDVRKILEGHLVRASIELQTVRVAARHYDKSFDQEIDLLLYRQQLATDHNDIDEAFRIDNEFHRTICKVAGFPNLWKTIYSSTGQLDRARRLAFSSPDFFAEVVSEHRAIYDATKNAKEIEAVNLMRAHLGSIREIVSHVLRLPEGVVHSEMDDILIDEIARI